MTLYLDPKRGLLPHDKAGLKSPALQSTNRITADSPSRRPPVALICLELSSYVVYLGLEWYVRY